MTLHRQFVRRWRNLAAGACALLLVAMCGAVQAAVNAEEVDALRARLGVVEARIYNAGAASTESIDAAIGETTDIKATGQECAAAAKDRLDSLKAVTESSTLPAVGAPSETSDKAGESVDADADAAAGPPGKQTDARGKLQQTLREIDVLLVNCRLLESNAENLISRLKETRAQQLRDSLLSRDQTGPGILARNISGVEERLARATRYLKSSRGLAVLSLNEALVALALALMGFLGGRFLRDSSHTLRSIGKHPVDTTEAADVSSTDVAVPSDNASEAFSVQLSRSMANSAYRYMPWIGAVLLPAVMLGLIFWHAPVFPLLFFLCVGALVWCVCSAIIETLLNRHVPLRPPQTAVWPVGLRRRLALQLRVHTALVIILVLIFETHLRGVLFDIGVFDLFRFALVTVLCANLFTLARLIRQIPNVTVTWRRLALVVLIASVVIAVLYWAGFGNLALFLLTGVMGTLFITGLLWVFGTALGDLFDGLDTGRRRWHTKLRQSIGVEPQQTVPGLYWIRLVTSFVLWVLFGISLIAVWGFGGTTLPELRTGLLHGFEFGSIRIVPSRILFGLVVFLVLLYLIRRLLQSARARLSRVAPREASSSDAMLSILGYVAVALVTLLGLSLAGVDFSNIAIVAGALSVGIGFGLQNIVNNFVSGLILLFERSVRKGDWVVVAGTEGFVREIRVRSTIVETFDRSEVVVPNAELISSQVTNWTLKNSSGRVTICIGVAYGSDTQLVEKLLREVAAENAGVVHDAPLSPVRVFFRGFGESTLDFELRCFVKNVWNRLQIESDLNFAIDRSFADNGIDIAFPQRDLHIKSMPAELLPGRESSRQSD